jgi:5'-methylthioadenosine phosphorylase
MSIAFIGGTGIYRMEGVEVLDAIDMTTPFGKPSDRIVRARYAGREVFFLPRHGSGHRFLPTEIPVKANIWALKKLGVGQIIGVSAVGSLKEEIRPRDIVIPTQIIDRTKARPLSFFGNGVVGHVGFADPFCPTLTDFLHKTAADLKYRVHRDETYVCMEGPLFSTRAESRLYRSWGGGVIGMTAIPESKLAREAEICYAIMAMSTDYDCWKEGGEDVTIEMIVANLTANSEAAQSVIRRIIETLEESSDCSCREAARYAILTDKKDIPGEARKNLGLFYDKYWRD